MIYSLSHQTQPWSTTQTLKTSVVEIQGKKFTLYNSTVAEDTVETEPAEKAEKILKSELSFDDSSGERALGQSRAAQI